ncbi:hypothetical protein AB0F68_32845 [Micromonospora sp. NPDC023966]|uniref:hypothetical protein n=1 Tax=Micromonospora sp. NPDC023966 TaxID=3154699 RepID=UPI0033C0FA59
MLFRRSKRQDVDALRAKVVANREKVQLWVGGWDFPEVEWPDVPEIPSPWIVRREDERMWWERHAPFIDEYGWMLEARPVSQGVTHVVANWQFGKGHTFDLLDIEIRSVADPGYLAEKLALGAHAADLPGWQEDDIQGLHAWLFEGIDSRPLGEMVRGQHRSGFIHFTLTRWPHSRTEINVRLNMTLTDTALDGTPLNSAGESPPA